VNAGDGSARRYKERRASISASYQLHYQCNEIVVNMDTDLHGRHQEHHNMCIPRRSCLQLEAACSRVDPGPALQSCPKIENLRILFVNPVSLLITSLAG
jgi:hypothetical protein